MKDDLALTFPLHMWNKAVAVLVVLLLTKLVGYALLENFAYHP